MVTFTLSQVKFDRQSRIGESTQSHEENVAKVAGATSRGSAVITTNAVHFIDDCKKRDIIPARRRRQMMPLLRRNVDGAF